MKRLPSAIPTDPSYRYPARVTGFRITSLSDGSVPATGGVKVYVFGVGFTHVIQIYIDYTPVTSFVIHDDYTISAVIPASAPGAYAVTAASSVDGTSNAVTLNLV